MSTATAPDRFTTLPREQALAAAVTALEEHGYGQHSQAGKILEIHQELPGRIHLVLIRQAIGF